MSTLTFSMQVCSYSRKIPVLNDAPSDFFNAILVEKIYSPLQSPSCEATALGFPELVSFPPTTIGAPKLR